MINDPTIECECDKCGSVVIVEPSFVYRTYSGESGYYDCSHSAISEKLETQEWESGELLFCPACKS